MSEPTPQKPAKDKTAKAQLALAAVNVLATLGLGAAVFLRPMALAHEATPASAGPESNAEGAPAASHAPAAPPIETPPAATDGAGEPSPSKNAGQALPPPLPALLALEDIIVHLRNPEADRYARIGLELELSSAAEVEAAKARIAPLRDIVIATLADRTYEELRGSQGLAKLKDDLTARVRVAFGAKFRALYLSDFVVQ